MKATTFIAAQQFGHASGSASNTFLMRRAQALRRSRWKVREGLGLWCSVPGRGVGGCHRPGAPPGSRGPGTAGVGPVQAGQVKARRGNVLAETSEHLEWVEGDSLLAGDRVRPPSAVGAGPACSRDLESIEGDGGVDEVAAEPLDPCGVLGFDADGVVH